MESHGIATFLRKRSLPKKSLARTSSSKTNQCAQARRIFRIPPQNKHKQRGGRLAPPPPLFVQNRLVRYWCLYYTKLEPIFKINSRNIPQGKALTREYARALAKRESGNVQMYRTAQMPVREPFSKMDEVLQKLFSGERILQNFG